MEDYVAGTAECPHTAITDFFNRAEYPVPRGFFIMLDNHHPTSAYSRAARYCVEHGLELSPMSDVNPEARAENAFAVGRRGIRDHEIAEEIPRIIDVYRILETLVKEESEKPRVLAAATGAAAYAMR